MARSPRDKFERELELLESDVDDPATLAALKEFAAATDPDVPHVKIPKPTSTGGVTYDELANNTAVLYLGNVRRAYKRGLDLLEADADTVNDFMADLVTDASNRRTDLVDGSRSLKRTTANAWQAGLVAFYRWADEPGTSDERADTNVSWPADEIHRFSEQSTPDADDWPDSDDLDAMREACLHSQNTRRDRAFLELVAGTGQRSYAIVTLRIKDIRLDADIPHVMLNPDIEGDGDKGVIEASGRWKPIVSDVKPIRQWINHHPFRDADRRAEYGLPDRFQDCYLFVGDLQMPSTDPTSHWSDDGARFALYRRKKRTAEISDVKTVTANVNPHSWRHYAYTRSKDLPIDEAKRKKVFGWKPDSNVGDLVYGHISNEEAGKNFAEAWAENFGSGSDVDLTEQLVGEFAGMDVSPEVRKELVNRLMSDERFKQQVVDAVLAEV